MLVQAAPLRSLITRILRQAGSGPAEAEQVGHNLVEANLTGHDSHGVISIIKYVRHVKAGWISPNQAVSILHDEGRLVALEGHRGYGQVIGAQAMDLGIERARLHGVCVVTLRNSSHLGRIGAWGERCAASGLVSTHHVNVLGIPAKVAPFHGTDGRFATNPYCCAMPGPGSGPPVVLDMATSVVAAGKVRVAHHRGERMPEGALIDHAGRPTTDPRVLEEEPFGALRPIGEHKGYGLAVINELLAGIVSGGRCMRRETIYPPDYPVINNMLSVIIDPARFTSRDIYDAEMAGAIDWITASPPAMPDSPVMIAGEPERLLHRQRERAGIPIPEETWRQMILTAQSVGLAKDEVLSLVEAAPAR